MVFDPIIVLNKKKVDHHQPQFTDSKDEALVMESQTKGYYVELFTGVTKLRNC